MNTMVSKINSYVITVLITRLSTLVNWLCTRNKTSKFSKHFQHFKIQTKIIACIFKLLLNEY